MYRSRVEIQLASKRARRSEFDLGCGHGLTDGERAHAHLDSRRGAPRRIASRGRYLQQVPLISMWLPARGHLLCVSVPSVLICFRFLSDPLSLHHIIIPHIVRHWFGTVKNFSRVDHLLRVLAPGFPACVARMGNLTAELAYGNHPSVAPYAVGCCSINDMC